MLKERKYHKKLYEQEKANAEITQDTDNKNGQLHF